MTLAQFRTRVRAYANDPATGGTWGKTGVNELAADAFVDGVGEEEYREACNFLRRHSPGFFRKTLVTATSSTQVHTWPSDFIRLYAPIVISNAGDDLSTDESLGEEVSIGTPDLIQDVVRAGSPQIWVPQEGGFRLYPKVTTTGTKALLLRYEYIPTFPSTSTDTFTWPDNHSQYLVIQTAATIRELNGLQSGHLRRKAANLAQDLLIDLKTVHQETEQFGSSYYEDTYSRLSNQGEVKPVNSLVSS